MLVISCRLGYVCIDLRMGTVLAFSPMHDRVRTQELAGEWLRSSALPWEQPFDAIKVCVLGYY